VIEETISAGHIEMPKILFMSCTQENNVKRARYLEMNVFKAGSLEFSHLFLALKRRDYEMVFFILEYGEKFGSGNSFDLNDIVLEAVKWGDKAVIEYMYDCEIIRPNTLRPFDLNDKGFSGGIGNGKELLVSALGEAMAAHNTELVNQLLKWGADPTEHIPFAVTIGDENTARFLLDQGGDPQGVREAISNGRHSILELLLDRGAAPVGLELTIESGKHDMMCLLLRYGADPANDDAFSAAVLYDDATFLSTLSDAFSSRYPNGRRGVGFRALETALICCDTSAFQHLLLLKQLGYEH
jgi:ankyrin repeat protein